MVDLSSEPLTEADLTEIKNRLGDLDRADAIIAKLARAGVDVTQQQQTSREQREQLLKLRQAFFPGR